MRAGQVTLQGGLVLAPVPEGVGLLAIRSGVALSDAAAIEARVGALRTSAGGIQLTDGALRARWNVVRTDTVVLGGLAGVALPLGSAGAELSWTPRSTGSVDPLLGARIVAGGTWLVAASADVRVPLAPGADRVLQGPYLSGDVRGARRLGGAVPWAGVALARSLPALEDGSGDFSELAATAGSTFDLSDRWALAVDARLPLAPEPLAPYAFAAGVGATWVIGKRKPAGEGDGDDHSDPA